MSTEWNADAYHRVSDPQFRWGMAVLARVAFEGDETVVDAGCGSGRVSAELAARVPRGRVIGLDRSWHMVAAAQRTAQQRAIGNLHVAVADLRRSPWPATQISIFSTATFHWILDHPRLFAEMRSALAPGGRLVAQCGGAGNLHTIHERAHALIQRDEWARHFAAWRDPWEFASGEVTAARLAAAGFTDIQTWLDLTPTAFADADAFAAFVSTVVLRPHLARLPSEPARERFVHALTELFAGDPIPFVLDYVRLNIAACTRG